MKRYNGPQTLEKKRRLPGWMAKPSLVVGALIVLVMVVMAIFPQFIAPYDPIETNTLLQNAPPSASHWFGTDFYGRDVFSRVVWGARIDLLIGVTGTLVPFVIGGLIGLLAGYYGGALDSILMRITDVMMAFPFTILVITIMAILGKGTLNLFIALWLVGWMSYARLRRGDVYAHRRVHELPGPGHPAACAGVGLHPQRGPQLHLLRLVDHLLLRPVPGHQRRGLLPAWRWADGLSPYKGEVSDE